MRIGVDGIQGKERQRRPDQEMPVLPPRVDAFREHAPLPAQAANRRAAQIPDEHSHLVLGERSLQSRENIDEDGALLASEGFPCAQGVPKRPGLGRHRLPRRQVHRRGSLQKSAEQAGQPPARRQPMERRHRQGRRDQGAHPPRQIEVLGEAAPEDVVREDRQGIAHRDRRRQGIRPAREGIWVLMEVGQIHVPPRGAMPRAAADEHLGIERGEVVIDPFRGVEGAGEDPGLPEPPGIHPEQAGERPQEGVGDHKNGDEIEANP